MQAGSNAVRKNTAPQERIEGLTAWRALLMLAGLPLHAAFGDEHYPAFAALILVSGSFRMGAFFMISGLLSGFALMRRASTVRWLGRRLAQLGLPTLVGLSVISPMVGMIVGADSPAWPIDPYHVWFLLGLIAYTLLGAAVHRIDGTWAIFDGVERRSREARRLQLALLLVTGLVSFTLMAVGRAIHGEAPPVLRPTTNHLPLILGYAPTFLLGFAAARAPTLRRMLTASQRVPLVILAIAVAAHLLLRSPWSPPLTPVRYGWWSDLLAVGSAAWCPLAATVLILRSAMAIRRVPPALHRIADASFTMYMLHYPIIVATKTGLRPLGWNVWTTFLLAALLGGGLSYAIHRRLVMRVPVLGWLLAGRFLPHRRDAPKVTPSTDTHRPEPAKDVGSFCCPVLPVPLESPSVARWGPTALS